MPGNTTSVRKPFHWQPRVSCFCRRSRDNTNTLHNSRRIGVYHVRIDVRDSTKSGRRSCTLCLLDASRCHFGIAHRYRHCNRDSTNSRQHTLRCTYARFYRCRNPSGVHRLHFRRNAARCRRRNRRTASNVHNFRFFDIPSRIAHRTSIRSGRRHLQAPHGAYLGKRGMPSNADSFRSNLKPFRKRYSNNNHLYR